MKHHGTTVRVISRDVIGQSSNQLYGLNRQDTAILCKYITNIICSIDTYIYWKCAQFLKINAGNSRSDADVT